MSTSVKISSDLAGKSIDPSLYRSMIGSLLYLTASRPNIAFSVGVCARFQVNPKESHLTVVKHIIRYVNDTLFMAYGILEKQILLLQDTLMQNGLKMLMIEKVPQDGASMWGTIL
jgi:hypothetical protein